MELVREIGEAFASLKQGKAMEIVNLAPSYPGWILRFEDWYGVAVQLYQDFVISERFSNARIWSNKMQIDGVEKNLLMLTSTDESLRYEFASVCAQFVDPGIDGSDRKSLCENPVLWWENWKNLLGNAAREKLAHGVLGELLVYEKLLDEDRFLEWMGPEASSHDFETDKYSIEVKSSLGRYSTQVTITGQHQLQVLKDKALYLVFCRFESSPFGECINDAVQRISENKRCTEDLNVKLSKIGFEPGCTARTEKFSLLEIRRYTIDETFPRITSSSFLDGKIPEAVIQITYTLDLGGLKFENWA